MTDLVVIRHGETDWNRQLRFQGQIDVPLNAAGEDQAQRLARRLAREKFDAVVASDLMRARRTAELSAARWGQPVQLSALWREQSFGILEGLDGATIRTRFPELWAAWRRHDADYALPDGGESVRAFHARVNQALAATVKAFPGQRVAVFSHGGVLDMLWRTAHELPLDGERECPIPNTGVNELRWKDGVLTVLRWGDDEHLKGR